MYVELYLFKYMYKEVSVNFPITGKPSFIETCLADLFILTTTQCCRKLLYVRQLTHLNTVCILS